MISWTSGAPKLRQLVACWSTILLIVDADPPAIARVLHSPRMRRFGSVALLGLFLAASSGAGCRPRTLQHPPKHYAPHSALLPEADRLIDAMSHNKIPTIVAWMSPTLRAQVSGEMLSQASQRIQRSYGEVLGIVEERLHREDDLLWYSGVVLHAQKQPQQPGPTRLMLYQFAIKPDRSLERLLVREHLSIKELEPPAENYLPVTRFHFPSDGEWTVAHGGRRKATNYHHNSRKQRFAYDLVVRKNGRQRTGNGKRNSQFFCYGKPVYAPASGTVIHAVDGVAENPPGKRGKKGGNGLVLDHGFGETSSLWHFIPGTLTVKKGDKVEVGQYLGKTGNSGSSSGPHIHFHVSTREMEASGFALPADFVEVYVDGRWQDRNMPVRGSRIRGVRPFPKPPLARGPEILLDF